jgi:hypothetical protein
MRSWFCVSVVCLVLVAAVASAQGPCPYVKCPGATCGGTGKPCNNGCGQYECGYVGYSCLTAASGCKGNGCMCPTYCKNGTKPCPGTASCSDTTYGCRKKGPDFKNCIAGDCGSAHCTLPVCKNGYPPCDNGTWCCAGCGQSGVCYSGCPSWVDDEGYGGSPGCETSGSPPYAHCRCGPCSCSAVSNPGHCNCNWLFCLRCGGNCETWCGHHTGSYCSTNSSLCKGESGKTGQ